MEIFKKWGIIALTCFLLTIVTSALVSAQYDYTWDESAAWNFLGLSLMICAIVMIIWLVIAILVGIWLYKDAEKRGKSGVVWFVLLLVASIFLGFIGFIIVIVVWLVIRPPIGGEKPATPERKCPNCGRVIPMDARICPYCNKKFEE